jgi:serine/threonine-protein kinase
MDPPQAPAELAPGKLVAGKYRLDRVLGYGGMGVVYAGLDVALDRPVALKTMLPELATDTEAIARFSREARAMGRLTSEHAVRVFELGELPDGVPYMTMELLDGADLDAILAQRGALPVGEAIDWILQAAEALAEAHAHGIVHRDLKLSNLFVVRKPDGRTLLKVLDFGLAKARASAPLTATTAIMGTPAYMPPEQLRRSKDVDARADLWALGACLYQLVTGRLPFDAGTVAEVTTMILRDTPRAPHELRAEIPPAISHAVLRCLEKDRERRWPSVGDLAGALASHARPEKSPASDRLSRITMWSTRTMPLQQAQERTPPEAFMPTPPIADEAATNVLVRRSHSHTNAGWSIAIAIGGVLSGVVVTSLVHQLRSTPIPAAYASQAPPNEPPPQTTVAAPPSEPPTTSSAVATASGSAPSPPRRVGRDVNIPPPAVVRRGAPTAPPAPTPAAPAAPAAHTPEDRY